MEIETASLDRVDSKLLPDGSLEGKQVTMSENTTERASAIDQQVPSMDAARTVEREEEMDEGSVPTPMDAKKQVDETVTSHDDSSDEPSEVTDELEPVDQVVPVEINTQEADTKATDTVSWPHSVIDQPAPDVKPKADSPSSTTQPVSGLAAEESPNDTVGAEAPQTDASVDDIEVEMARDLRELPDYIVPSEVTQGTDQNPERQPSIIEEVWNSIFTPGINSRVQGFMNLVFVGLFLSLGMLAFATGGNIHVFALLGIAICLFACVQWFIRELAKLPPVPVDGETSTKKDD
ncbi:hypothetical protein HDU85_000664 [Gaertneriomyces sp. JEL0708]|nr:hypothetical protein HDU85_000664 [Gaertneriomyces sp. JEL0708]